MVADYTQPFEFYELRTVDKNPFSTIYIIKNLYN